MSRCGAEFWAATAFIEHLRKSGQGIYEKGRAERGDSSVDLGLELRAELSILTISRRPRGKWSESTPFRKIRGLENGPPTTEENIRHLQSTCRCCNGRMSSQE